LTSSRATIAIAGFIVGMACVEGWQVLQCVLNDSLVGLSLSRLVHGDDDVRAASGARIGTGILHPRQSSRPTLRRTVSVTPDRRGDRSHARGVGGEMMIDAGITGLPVRCRGHGVSAMCAGGAIALFALEQIFSPSDSTAHSDHESNK
jgi:hypothetical protein